MTLDTWILYVGTVLVFMSTPGPSHLLMLSVGMSQGFHRSLATAAGDLSANVVQIALAGFGLATLVVASRHGFAVVKWLGVVYLVWIGIRQIIHSYRDAKAEDVAVPASLSSLWFRGFVTSAANPKAVVFFAALFPQFLDLSSPLVNQILILGATYIVIDGCFLAAYGRGASWLASKLSVQAQAWLDRMSGALLIATASFLGFKTLRE